jgi:hypothetical protein
MQRMGRGNFSARKVWMIERVRKVPGLKVYRMLGRILHADGHLPGARRVRRPRANHNRGYARVHPQNHSDPNLRTQILRKLIGGEGSPCACSLIGASWYGLNGRVPLLVVSPLR